MKRTIPRVSRIDYFLGLAVLAASRGTCKRAKVGCVLTRNNKVIATGYNSSHRGTPHCDEVGCLIKDGHCVRCLHAEEAAVLNLEKRYEDIVAYVTHSPCLHCYKIMTGAGVKVIHYINDVEEYSQSELQYPHKLVDDPAYEELILKIGVFLIKVVVLDPKQGPQQLFSWGASVLKKGDTNV